MFRFVYNVLYIPVIIKAILIIVEVFIHYWEEIYLIQGDVLEEN